MYSTTIQCRAACYIIAHGWLHTSKQPTPFVSDSPKQATGLKLELELVLVGVSFWIEKPSGHVEHSRKEPTEHLTDCTPQLVTLHSESVSVEYVYV